MIAQVGLAILVAMFVYPIVRAIFEWAGWLQDAPEANNEPTRAAAWRQLALALLVVVCCSGVSIAGGYMAVSALRKQIDLLAHERMADGVVTRVEYGGKSHDEVLFRFDEHTGSETFWRAWNYRSGDRVTAYYPANKPEQAVLSRWSHLLDAITMMITALGLGYTANRNFRTSVLDHWYRLRPTYLDRKSISNKASNS